MQWADWNNPEKLETPHEEKTRDKAVDDDDFFTVSVSPAFTLSAATATPLATVFQGPTQTGITPRMANLGGHNLGGNPPTVTQTPHVRRHILTHGTHCASKIPTPKAGRMKMQTGSAPRQSERLLRSTSMPMMTRNAARTLTKTKGTQKVTNITDKGDVQFVFDTTLVSDPKEPKGILQALKGKEGEQWRESARREFQNFIDQDSWKVVNKEEARNAGKTIAGSKWVFKKKQEPDGTTRYKS